MKRFFSKGKDKAKSANLTLPALLAAVNDEGRTPLMVDQADRDSDPADMRINIWVVGGATSNERYSEVFMEKVLSRLQPALEPSIEKELTKQQSPIKPKKAILPGSAQQDTRPDTDETQTTNVETLITLADGTSHRVTFCFRTYSLTDQNNPRASYSDENRDKILIIAYREDTKKYNTIWENQARNKGLIIEPHYKTIHFNLDDNSVNYNSALQESLSEDGLAGTAQNRSLGNHILAITENILTTERFTAISENFKPKKSITGKKKIRAESSLKIMIDSTDSNENTIEFLSRTAKNPRLINSGTEFERINKLNQFLDYTNTLADIVFKNSTNQSTDKDWRIPLETLKSVQESVKNNDEWKHIFPKETREKFLGFLDNKMGATQSSETTDVLNGREESHTAKSSSNTKAGERGRHTIFGKSKGNGTGDGDFMERNETMIDSTL